MIRNFTALAAVAILCSAPALAQTVAPTSTKVSTDEEGKLLIGESLVFNEAASGNSGGDTDTLIVLEAGTLKAAGEWTEADRKACTASGGAALPVGAGLMACLPS